MKTLKLNKLQTNQLADREMKEIAGGTADAGNCCCACAYENQGGSSSSANFNANFGSGKSSPGCILL